jgi:hypothetical protein
MTKRKSREPDTTWKQIEKALVILHTTTPISSYLFRPPPSLLTLPSNDAPQRADILDIPSARMARCVLGLPVAVHLLRGWRSGRSSVSSATHTSDRAADSRPLDAASHG